MSVNPYYVNVEKIIEEDESIMLSKISFDENYKELKKMFTKFDKNFNGVLEDKEACVMNNNNKFILVINTDKITTYERYRFTLAHELGHIKLKHVENKKILCRDSLSKTGEDLKEIEANNFAANLLMPVELIIDMVESGKTFAEIKDTFKVSIGALTNRLSNLGYNVSR